MVAMEATKLTFEVQSSPIKEGHMAIHTKARVA